MMVLARTSPAFFEPVVSVAMSFSRKISASVLTTFDAISGSVCWKRISTRLVRSTGVMFRLSRSASS